MVEPLVDSERDCEGVTLCRNVVEFDSDVARDKLRLCENVDGVTVGTVAELEPECDRELFFLLRVLDKECETDSVALQDDDLLVNVPENARAVVTEDTALDTEDVFTSEATAPDTYRPTRKIITRPTVRSVK